MGGGGLSCPQALGKRLPPVAAIRWVETVPMAHRCYRESDLGLKQEIRAFIR